MRVEKDSLGEKTIPDGTLWGVQAARAVENFPITGEPISRELVRAYAYLKKACTRANQKLGLLKPELAIPMLKAIDEILAGKHDNQFVIDIFQAGAGTSTNMNLNEVIANRALELIGKKPGQYEVISPNDHVNMAQSTNDTYPTAMRMAVVLEFEALDNNLELLEKTLLKRGKDFAGLIKSARTHLQDAVPITLGQEFTAYGVTVAGLRGNLHQAKEALSVLGIGGSAAGTGINTHPDYAKLVVKFLNEETKQNFKNSPDMVESMQSQRQMQDFASAMKLAAIEISRIASDLRLMASGPSTGLAEITLPAVQPGSSIMPGKVNPSILECVNMICYRVMGAETAISQAVLGGQLNLNVNMPLMSSEALYSMKILGNGAKIMADKAVKDLAPNTERLEDYALKSASLATVLNPVLGYLVVADLVKEFVKTGKSFREIILERGLMSPKEVDKVLDPRNMTRPSAASAGKGSSGG